MIRVLIVATGTTARLFKVEPEETDEQAWRRVRGELLAQGIGSTNATWRAATGPGETVEEAAEVIVNELVRRGVFEPAGDGTFRIP
jgi:hypothetical protein